MTVTARNPLRWIVLSLGAFLAAAAMLLSSAGGAIAASNDDGDDADLPYSIVVNVRSGGEAVEGATITVTCLLYTSPSPRDS